MAQLNPAAIPIPGVAQDPGVKPATRPVTLYPVQDTTGQALQTTAAFQRRDIAANASAADAVTHAAASFQSDIEAVARTFQVLADKRQAQENRAFVDRYQLDYNKRAAQITQDALNSPDAAKPNFVNLLDQKLAEAQSATLHDLHAQGAYSPDQTGINAANATAMSVRASTARTAAITAHNQRLAVLLDSANTNIQDIARTARETGDLSGTLSHALTTVNSLAGVIAPDKLIKLKNVVRTQIIKSAVTGFIDRGQTDHWKAILDQNGHYSGVDQIVASAAKKYGVDPAYLVATAHLESSGNPGAGSPIDPNTGKPASSASGLFQFTSKTAQAYGLPADAKTATVEEQADAAARLAKDNAAILKSALGRSPRPGELYLAHFLGPEGATKILKAAPDTPISQILSAKAIQANASVLGGDKTASDVADWAAIRVIAAGGDRVGASMGTATGDNLAAADAAMHLTPQERNLYQMHLENLYGPGGVTNPDGSRSTLFQAVVEHDGLYYNIPTVWNGQRLVDANGHPTPEAIAHVEAIGWDHFPSYASADQADKRYMQMHAFMEKDTAGYFQRQKELTNTDIGRFLSEADRASLLKAADAHSRAALIDQQRKITLHNAQLKAASNQAEGEFFGAIATHDPKVTATMIVNDKRLLPAAQERLVRLLGQAGGAAKDERTYGSGFYDLFNRVHAAPNDPNRITDVSQLYSHVGPNGDLTLQGLDKLRTEMAARGTPAAAAEASMKKQFLDNAKRQISGTNPLIGLRDPHGDELYLKFLAQFWPAYEAGIKAGKSPTDMLDPKSSDYLGKSIEHFKRPMNQWLADMASANAVQFGPEGSKQGANVATPSANSFSTSADVVSAYHAGKLTYKQAGDILIARGWAVADKAPAPAESAASSQSSFYGNATPPPMSR